ncbi:hypothetical protein B0J12DRAFT_10092 [Macrophomina phaseolina]|uniref:Uncharacterized protein n=1 Tax=Macrophomina phaseolina TaxID=35725 RepID=A0ABQ8GU13_9PEZI|nr:hypothetical protein B0J12DRAFT_10092 [Macrophomina phaseolina]
MQRVTFCFSMYLNFLALLLFVQRGGNWHLKATLDKNTEVLIDTREERGALSCDWFVTYSLFSVFSLVTKEIVNKLCGVAGSKNDGVDENGEIPCVWRNGEDPACVGGKRTRSKERTIVDHPPNAFCMRVILSFLPCFPTPLSLSLNILLVSFCY